jgi:hypothetical protein
MKNSDVKVASANLLLGAGVADVIGAEVFINLKPIQSCCDKGFQGKVNLTSHQSSLLVKPDNSNELLNLCWLV